MKRQHGGAPGEKSNGWFLLAGLLLGAALTACTSLNLKLQDAYGQECTQLLSDYEAYKADPEYPSTRSSIRRPYEFDVATCLLDRRQPEQALALSKTWPEDAWRYRSKIAIRASTQLDDVETFKAAMNRLGTDISTDFLTDYPEFGLYAFDDWFLRALSRRWVQEGTVRLESFASRVARLRKEKLLELKLASADEERPPGELAVWFGLVRKARLDRDADQTIFVVEGVDVRTELVGVSDRLTGVRRDSWNSVTAEYEEVRHYVDMAHPNGRYFVVKHPKASEKMVSMSQIAAFGTYSGRTPEKRWPTLESLLVRERKSDQ